MANKEKKPRVIRINFSWFYLLLVLGIGWMIFSNRGASPAKVEWPDVRQMILNGDCGAFNPKLMEAFRNSRAEFKEIASEGAPIEDAMEEANVEV